MSVLQASHRWGERKYLISYLGGIQTLNPEHTKIRREMTERCTQQHNTTICNWIQLSHTSTDSTIISAISVYRTSIFCLCPPGDDPARKALFDILLSGCIPILFHPSTLFNQYPLHFPKNIPQEISVYFPGKFLKLKKIPFIDMISAISWETVERKQSVIEMIGSRIQYSLPPLEMLQRRDDERVWDPPVDVIDAVDVMINGLITRAKRIKRNVSTELPPVVLTNTEWFQRYSSVMVT
jgi:xyloglucan galactosyltransferase MUR3